MKTHKNIILRALIISTVMLLTALSSAHAVTMNYQGGWLATTTYPAGAVVILNNQSYYALLGCTKLPPTEVGGFAQQGAGD